MTVLANPTEFGENITVRITAPSPLVGEGITCGRPVFGWVRGTANDIATCGPLTRLRFAKPPSPTRGEGKNPATYSRRTA
jgi:hypothetical protein